MSHHVLYVLTLVSLLLFTSRMQSLLLSQSFLLWCSFKEWQCVQEASARLLLVFLWHSHLLCWSFASLVNLVLPCIVLFIFTLFCIYICLQQHFFAVVCSGGEYPDYIPATLLCLVLLSELQCVAVYSTV